MYDVEAGLLSMGISTLVLWLLLLYLLFYWCQCLTNLDFLLRQYLIRASTLLGFNFSTVIKWESENFLGLPSSKGTCVSWAWMRSLLAEEYACWLIGLKASPDQCWLRWNWMQRAASVFPSLWCPSSVYYSQELCFVLSQDFPTHLGNMSPSPQMKQTPNSRGHLSS